MAEAVKALVRVLSVHHLEAISIRAVPVPALAGQEVHAKAFQLVDLTLGDPPLSRSQGKIWTKFLMR